MLHNAFNTCNKVIQLQLLIIVVFHDIPEFSEGVRKAQD